MPDVTDEELRKEIEKILKNADLAKTSTNKVIQKLEEIFDVELADRKKTIDQMVLDYVNSQESEEEEDDDEEEEEVKKPPKRSSQTNAKKTRSKKPRTSTSEEEEDDDSNDSEYEEKKPKPKKQAAKGKKGGGGGKGGGYTRAYKLSPALADLMGAEEMPRHEVVKRMWAIIREKKLYDPNNKQFAICDDALYKVIGTKRFRAFGMMKYLKAHFLDE